jgi:hypothetical protein
VIILEISETKENDPWKESPLSGEHFERDIKLLNSGEVENIKKSNKKGNNMAVIIFLKNKFDEKINSKRA